MVEIWPQACPFFIKINHYSHSAYVDYGEGPHPPSGITPTRILSCLYALLTLGPTGEVVGPMVCNALKTFPACQWLCIRVHHEFTPDNSVWVYIGYCRESPMALPWFRNYSKVIPTYCPCASSLCVNHISGSYPQINQHLRQKVRWVCKVQPRENSSRNSPIHWKGKSLGAIHTVAWIKQCSVRVWDWVKCGIQYGLCSGYLYMFWAAHGRHTCYAPRGHIRNAHGGHRYLVCPSRAYQDSRQGC